MDEVEKLQGDIIDLFKRTLTKRVEGYNLSFPFIPRISKEYLKSRVVIVGQETNTWYNTGNGSDYHGIFLEGKNNIEIEALDRRYDVFVRNHVSKYGGKFWQFNRSLYSDNGIFDTSIVKDGELSHCWINLFSMEACVNKKDSWGRPTKNQELRKSVLNIQGKLTFELLKLLKPKIIIFLTGAPLDYVIKEYALNSEIYDLKSIDEYNVLEEKHAAKIEVDKDSPFYETDIFRLYHPSYFLGYINGHKTLKEKLKDHDHNPSSYYLSKVTKQLKECVSN